MARDETKHDAAEAEREFDANGPISPARALTPFAVKLNTVVVRRGFWPKMVRVARHVPFAADAVALFYAAMDKATPWQAKGILFAALAYFVLPTDMIPDILPGIGFTDDAAVIAAALGVAGRAIQDRHREAARAWLDKLTGEA